MLYGLRTNNQCHYNSVYKGESYQEIQNSQFRNTAE